MQYAEDQDDIDNVEAWAEIIEDMLYCAPFDSRMKVLQLAVVKQQAAIAEMAEHGPLRVWPVDEFLDVDTPGLRHWNAIMRLKSLIVQLFTRNIRNNHSPANAAKMLFAQHRYGSGSGYLGDYINDLVELDRG